MEKNKTGNEKSFKACWFERPCDTKSTLLKHIPVHREVHPGGNFAMKN